MSSWLSSITQKIKNWWNSGEKQRDAHSGMIHIREENVRSGFRKFKYPRPEFPLRGNSLRRHPEQTIAVRFKSDDPNEGRYLVRASGHLGAPMMVVRFPNFKLTSRYAGTNHNCRSLA